MYAFVVTRTVTRSHALPIATGRFASGQHVTGFALTVLLGLLQMNCMLFLKALLYGL